MVSCTGAKPKGGESGGGPAPALMADAPAQLAASHQSRHAALPPPSVHPCTSTAADACRSATPIGCFSMHSVAAAAHAQ
eukprot:3355768-Rhodomonas_salina.1